jgi:type III pantothenate kinase
LPKAMNRNMILTMNIGNTNFAQALMDGRCIHRRRTQIESFEGVRDFEDAIYRILAEGKIDPEKITGTVFASVNPYLSAYLEEAVIKVLSKPPVIISPFLNIKLDLAGYEVSDIGNDRIAVCEAAISKFHAPLIVFDFGTATTINIVDSQGRFLGGSIMPGLMMGVGALAKDTAQLPKTELSAYTPLMGRNARECIASGAVFGNASMLEGMVRRINEKLGQKAKVIITGGNADYIIPLCNIPVAHEPDLLFEGLLVIYRANKN